MLDKSIYNVHALKPIIHNITNYVTVNDCANVLLACGASPIMADDALEVAEITRLCQGLNINIGTLNQRTVESMLIAGQEANKLQHPVILDPVGAGASKFRTQTALQLLKEVQFTVIKGNISEIKALANASTSTQGVDANVADQVTEENLATTISFAKNFAKQTKAIIVISGAIDLVADEKQAYAIYNGHPLMAKVTGTGCQLSALIAAFVSANPEAILNATACAVIAMGIAGERAYTRLESLAGNASYRNYIIDAIYNLTDAELIKGAKYELY